MATYIQIGSTVTVGSGGAANIDFTSIPATFTDLVILLSSRTATGGAADVEMQLNSDTTGTNYARLQIQANGSTVASSIGAGNQTGTSTGSTDTSSTFASNSIYIPNYLGSSYKSYATDTVTENNATTAYATLRAGIWNNGAAITNIRLKHGSGANFVQYSTASLYGIKNS
jgi:hypothetical protein